MAVEVFFGEDPGWVLYEAGAFVASDLGNPTSNLVYRRIGYRAVSEGLRYRFE
jgi:hypothetical protein